MYQSAGVGLRHKMRTSSRRRKSAAIGSGASSCGGVQLPDREDELREYTEGPGDHEQIASARDIAGAGGELDRTLPTRASTQQDLLGTRGSRRVKHLTNVITKLSKNFLVLRNETDILKELLTSSPSSRRGSDEGRSDCSGRSCPSPYWSWSSRCSSEPAISLSMRAILYRAAWRS